MTAWLNNCVINLMKTKLLCIHTYLTSSFSVWSLQIKLIYKIHPSECYHLHLVITPYTLLIWMSWYKPGSLHTHELIDTSNHWLPLQTKKPRHSLRWQRERIRVECTALNYNTFLQQAGNHTQDDTASQTWGHNQQSSLQWEPHAPNLHCGLWAPNIFLRMA